MSTVRTRFAPSPTGHLHVGGARTALFCWAYARRQGGQFILRIEDTDRKRSSEAASQGFLDDLDWLGIGWDEGPEYAGHGGGDAGPYYQSQRLELYHQHIQQLIEQGHAYRAFETPEQLAEARKAAEAAGTAYRYDRAGMFQKDAVVQRYLDEGRPHVVRFKVPDVAGVSITDVVRGTVTVPAEKLDDFVVLKADGFPTYHFAVVVDDQLMGVTHVIRGQEHLENAAKHMLLQQALKFPHPVYAHISLIFNPDGSKMSKRDKDKALRRVVQERELEASPGGPDGAPIVPQNRWTWWLSKKDHQLEADVAACLADALEVPLPEIDVEDFRHAGYLPEVMVNYLALLGWSPGDDVEKFDAAWLVEHFDLDRIIKSPAKFDRDKLLSFNLDALQALDAAAFEERLRAHGERYHADFMQHLGAERFPMFATCNQARSKTLDDPFRSCRFLVIADDAVVYERSKPVRKALENGSPNGYAHLQAVRATLADANGWTVESLERAVSDYAEAHAGGKVGKVAQPLRIAVTGGVVSPAIWETLVLLGRDATLARIDRCLSLQGTA